MYSPTSANKLYGESFGVWCQCKVKTENIHCRLDCRQLGKMCEAETVLYMCILTELEIWSFGSGI